MKQPALGRGSTLREQSLRKVVADGELPDFSSSTSRASLHRALSRGTSRGNVSSEGRLIRKDTSDSKQEAELKQTLEATAQLFEEVQELLGESGRQDVAARPGHPCQVQLKPGTARNVEVDLLAGQDAPTSERSVYIHCRPELLPGEDESAAADQLYDLRVGESSSDIVSGLFMALSLDKSVHEVQFVTSSASVVVSLQSHSRRVRVTLRCRCVLARSGGDRSRLGKQFANSLTASSRDLESSSSSGGDEELQNLRNADRRFHAKLAQRRRLCVVAKGALGKRLLAKGKGAEYLMTSPHYLMRRVMVLWLGPCNRFFGNHRSATGSWVQSLSPECPRKLLRYLLRSAQERRSVVILSVVGAFSFLLRRQRELHIARARMALKQLAWYKSLVAMSMLKATYNIVVRGREEAKRERARIRMSVLSVSRQSFVSRPSSVAKAGQSKTSTSGDGARKSERSRASTSSSCVGFNLSAEEALRQRLAAQGFTATPCDDEIYASRGLVCTGELEPSEGALSTTDAVTSRRRESVKLDRKSFRLSHGEMAPSADEGMPRQRGRQVQLDRGCHEKRRMVKRWRLSFLEDCPSDAPWLGPQQSKMMVIEGKYAFLTPLERGHVESQLLGVHEARKLALQSPGIFPPLEAVLLAHPVIVALALGTARSNLHCTFKPPSWKTKIFVGRPELASGRDATGASLVSAAQSGGRMMHQLRKLGHTHGNFMVSTGPSPEPQHGMLEWSGTFLATTTASGFPVRSFLDKPLPILGATQGIVRYVDTTLRYNLPVASATPRMQSRAKPPATASDSRGATPRTPASAQSELPAQDRYNKAIMQSPIPQKAQKFKEQDTAPSPRSRSDRTPATAGPDPHSPRSPTAADASPTELGEEASPAGPRSGLAWGLEEAVARPRTAAEVGKLVEQFDALETILGDDPRGFARRSPVGWMSGYRDTPMTMEEIRNARIVQRSLLRDHRQKAP